MARLSDRHPPPAAVNRPCASRPPPRVAVTEASSEGGSSVTETCSRMSSVFGCHAIFVRSAVFVCSAFTEASSRRSSDSAVFDCRCRGQVQKGDLPLPSSAALPRPAPAGALSSAALASSYALPSWKPAPRIAQSPPSSSTLPSLMGTPTPGLQHQYWKKRQAAGKELVRGVAEVAERVGRLTDRHPYCASRPPPRVAATEASYAVTEKAPKGSSAVAETCSRRRFRLRLPRRLRLLWRHRGQLRLQRH